ncbi:hypothetical protein [Marinomonas sp. 2405UD68-3]|uniref:hypothetical protein n=1 Tax=Marinomonas sp. 2405UD68-3 TaxID=3391835 RepID=UPI0039C92A18
MAGDILTTNEWVVNKVYSAFIEEMLHLQLASNRANTVGVNRLSKVMRFWISCLFYNKIQGSFDVLVTDGGFSRLVKDV